MSGRRKTARFAARPAMNVTPLVDVVLVLLIVFMVVIPALQQGLAIEIPGIFNVDPKKDGEGPPHTVSVTKNGGLVFEEEELGWNRLEQRMRAASRREPGRRLLLRADKQAPYGKVRRVYQIAQEVGYPGVSLKVNARHGDDRGPATRAQ